MKVLVYGWYGKNNIGDDLFCEAFKKMFPNYDFTFTDRITVDLLSKNSAVFFGGGSFLYNPPLIIDNAIDMLLTKPIFYIGVGVETGIHSTHIKIMEHAKLIATRTPNIEKSHPFFNKIIEIPDIVYSLKEKVINNKKIDKSVLVMPNGVVVPKNSDPLWKYNIWEYYKSEFSQFLDFLIEEKYNVHIFPMCANAEANDAWTGIELLNRMSKRGKCQILDAPRVFSEITNVLSKYETIITGRFHGIVLAELVERPYISIFHHDKLKETSPKHGTFIPYNEFSKDKMIKSFKALTNYTYDYSMNIKFKQLINIVTDTLG